MTLVVPLTLFFAAVVFEFIGPLFYRAQPGANIVGYQNDDDDEFPDHGVNPATGLPMMDDFFDAGGNPFGSDMHSHNMSDSDLDS